jgi:hypothetical protein
MIGRDFKTRLSCGFPVWMPCGLFAFSRPVFVEKGEIFHGEASSSEDGILGAHREEAHPQGVW